MPRGRRKAIGEVVVDLLSDAVRSALLLLGSILLLYVLLGAVIRATSEETGPTPPPTPTPKAACEVGESNYGTDACARPR